jgi:hypothetical protein
VFGFEVGPSLKIWPQAGSKARGRVITFEFGWSFGTNLDGDFQEVEVTPILGLLVIFSMSTEGDCR